jgi:hypothetical protein
MCIKEKSATKKPTTYFEIFANISKYLPIVARSSYK